MGVLRPAGLLACVLVLAGCALGGSDGADEITQEELAIMVLPRDEFGAALSALEVDREDSGRVSAKEAAESTTDPHDTAADLKQAGWVDGYELNFSDPNRNISFERGDGLIVVGSTVDLFDTATSARAYIVRNLRDFERFRGKNVQGVRLAKFETFDVNVGDEGWGMEFTARVGRVKMQVTGVVFRSGRVVADGGFMRADDTPMRSEALKAAQALESRIERVLAGQLDAEPVPLPVPVKAAPLPRAAQLARMTLELQDLPPGAHLVDEGRWTKGKNSVSYYRTFDVEQTMVGTSHLQLIRAETRVFATDKAAEAALRSATSPEGRGLFARNVVRGFARITGATAQNVVVRPLTRTGANAAGFAVTFDLPSGRFKTATLFVRSGRALASVTGFCRAQSVNPDDMRPLAATARARLAA
jgi:hypothetical protein